MVLVVKNPPAGSIPVLEDPLEEGMASNSSILAWKIPWSEDHRMHLHFAKILTFWELEDNKKIEGKV